MRFVLHAWMLGAILPLSADGQEPVDSQAVLARVQRGGDLIDLRWSRDAEGNLSARADGVDPLPLFRNGLGDGFASAGIIGYLCLSFPGPSDLLGLTDGPGHLRRAGVGTADAELRQFLALPLPEGNGGKARAELLDRMVAIDEVRRRRVAAAAVALRQLGERESVPAELRERALDALAALEGGGARPRARARLDPDELLLPLAADVLFAWDPSRMPDPQPLMVLAGPAGRLVTMREIVAAGGRLAPATSAFGQMLSEVSGELPFELARVLGNQRVDHVAGGLVIRADATIALAITAAGAFAVEPLAAFLEQQGMPVERRDDLRVTRHENFELRLGAERVEAGTQRFPIRKHPKHAASLLAPGPALRVVVLATSKVALLASFAGLPETRSAELRLSFDPGWLLEVEVQARDEVAAEAWVEFGKEQLPVLLAQLRAFIATEEPPGGIESLEPLLAALEKAKITAKEATVTGVVDLRHLGTEFLRRTVQPR